MSRPRTSILEGPRRSSTCLRSLGERDGRTLVLAEHRLAPLLPLHPRLVLLEEGKGGPPAAERLLTPTWTLSAFVRDGRSPVLTVARERSSRARPRGRLVCVRRGSAPRSTHSAPLAGRGAGCDRPEREREDDSPAPRGGARTPAGRAGPSTEEPGSRLRLPASSPTDLREDRAPRVLRRGRDHRRAAGRPPPSRAARRPRGGPSPFPQPGRAAPADRGDGPLARPEPPPSRRALHWAGSGERGVDPLAGPCGSRARER